MGHCHFFRSANIIGRYFFRDGFFQERKTNSKELNSTGNRSMDLVWLNVTAMGFTKVPKVDRFQFLSTDYLGAAIVVVA